MDKPTAKTNYLAARADLECAFSEDPDDPRNDREYDIEIASLNLRRAKEAAIDAGCNIDACGDIAD